MKNYKKIGELDPSTPKLPTFEKLHGKLVTCRDFMGAGLLPFSASMIMPSWLNMFASSGVAEAADIVCGSADGSGLSAFMTYKLSGGASLAGNLIPLDAGGQLLASYSKVGGGKGSNLQITTEFSNQAMFHAQSGLLAGIRAMAKPLTLQRTSFVGVPVRSADDNGMNKFDISGMVAKAGYAGKMLPNLGRAATATGLNATYALVAPSAPLIVARFEDIVGALGVTGVLSTLTQTQKEKLFNAVKNVSASQAAAIENRSGGKTLSQLMQCANIGNANLAANSTAGNVTPLANAAYAAVWALTANSSTSSSDFVLGSMWYNSIMGNAGTVNFDDPGYDYHDGTRTSGDTKDTQAGRNIGKLLESLAVLNKKGMIIVCSDGSVSSAESDVYGSPWMSDRGTAGMMYMITYNPTLSPQTSGNMIGNFTADQVADETFISGGSPDMAAASIFANFLNFNKKISVLENIIPRTFSSDDLKKVIKIS